MSDGVVMLYDGKLNPYPNLYGFTTPSRPNVNFSTVDVYNSEPETAQTTLEKTTTSTKSESAVIKENAGDNIDAMATLDIKRQKVQERSAEKNNQQTIAVLEADNIKHGQACVMGFGITFLILAMVSAVVAFGTPDWRVYSVDPSKADKSTPLYICNPNYYTTSTCPFYSSRRRGLFTTCYADQTLLSFFPKSIIATPWLTGDFCVWEQKYNIQSTPITVDNNCGQDVNFNNPNLMVAINANLMRTQWLAFALAILVMFLALIFALLSQCQARMCGSLFAGILTLTSTILLLIGMAFFHGYTYMEEQVLRCLPYFATLMKDTYKTLYQGTESSFGFSFFLGWFSVGLGILASSFLLVGACQRRQSQKIINKAMGRLNQIAKEERAEKKYEEMEARKKRKELEKKMRKEERTMKSQTSGPKPRPISFFQNLFPRAPAKKPKDTNLSDSEISYNFDAKSDEERRKHDMKLKEQERKYNEWEKEEEEKLKAKKKKFIEKRERELKELENEENSFARSAKRKSEPEKRKPKKNNRKSMDSSSDSQSDSDDDDHHRHGSKRCSRRRHQSFDNSIKGWDPKCGKIISPAPFMQHNSCCDPYTLHLPTGMAPAYYP